VDALGIELTDISLRKPSLDEAFLHLTDRTVARQ
jgi:ABC-2 type transport system ATP-binding protein